MLYTARLQSQTDDQWRVRTLEAKNVAEARKIIERRELNRVAYSLTDRAPIPQIATRRHADGVHATLNLDLFAGSGLGGHELLHYVEREHAIDADGKAYGPSRHIKSHLQAHYQREPYRLTSVEPFIPRTDQIILALKQLQQNDGAWARTLQALKDAGLPMAAVTAALYGLTAQTMIDGSAPIVWSSATIKTALLTGYTLNNDIHDFFNDVSGTEITGTGYTAGGVTLGSKASTYDTATDQIRLDAADASWASSTLSATDAVVYNDTAGASSTDPVMGAVDFGATVSTTAGTFQITWDATGIIVYDVT